MTWVPIEKFRLPENNPMVLVTNNLRARDAFGHMSHLWLADSIELQQDGTWTAYDGAVEVACNITHWIPAIPDEWINRTICPTVKPV